MALALIPSTLLVFATGLLIAYRLPLRGAGERMTAAMTLTFATLTAELLFAGVILGTLNPLVIGALAVGGLVVSALAAGARRPDAWVRIAAIARDDAMRAISVARQSRALLILGVGLTAALAWHLLLAVRLPIIDWDGLAYHLVTVDVWLQTDHIGRVPQLLWSDGYPENGELVTTWLVLFGHSDAFADLTGLVALPLAVTAIATFARRLGADRVPAALTALVIVAMPAVVLKTSSTYVDNIGMAYIAAAWAFGVGALRSGDRKRQLVLAIMTGVSIGLAIGTKASLIPAAALIGIAVLVVVVRERWSGPARSVVFAVVAISVPVLVGAGWYIKNLIVFGNPLWPITVGSLPGLGPAAQLIAKPPPEIAGMAPLAQIAKSWTNDFFLLTYLEDVRIGGFGVAWLPLLALGVIGAVVHVRKRGWLVLALLGVPTAATLVLMPGPWWPRYTLFLAVLAAGFAALALSRGPRTVRVIGVPLLAALALWSVVMANRTGNYQLHAGGPYRPSLGAVVKLLRSNAVVRRHISHWEECQAFESLPVGARVRTDGFQFPHLIIGSHLERALLIPFFGPAISPEAAISFDGEVATHLVISDPVHIAAARADQSRFTPLGSACRGAEMFAVNANA